MYIQVTMDLKNYQIKPIELRLSDQHAVKKAVDIAWRVAQLSGKPKEGCWIRVPNKDTVFAGSRSLADCSITTGDRIEIL